MASHNNHMKAQTQVVRVYEAPDPKIAHMAKMISDSGGTPPPALKPRHLRNITVKAVTKHAGRLLIAARLVELGYTIISLNVGHENFIAYVKPKVG